MSVALQALLEMTAALPRVEDPWPETIGLSFPFSAAGTGGVLANVLWSSQTPAERDRMTSIGGLWGFRAGALIYLGLSLNQLLSAA